MSDGNPRMDAGLQKRNATELVRIHRSLSKIERVWKSYEAAECLTGFQRWDWVSHLVREVAQKRAVEFLAVELLDDDGRPLMLLPFVSEKRRGVRRLSFLDFETSDYTVPILAADRDIPPGIPKRLPGHLKAALRDVDLVQLPRMTARVAGAPNPLLHLGQIVKSQWDRYELTLERPPAQVLERVANKSTVRRFRGRLRRLERLGTVNFELVSEVSQIEQVFDTLLEQRRIRFGEQGRYNLLAEDDVARFYRSAALAGPADGPVRLFALRLDGRCVATHYTLVHGRTLYKIIDTMDSAPELSRCSPGLLITALTMEWAAEHGLETFDLTYGDLPYKEELGARRSPLFELAMPLSLKGRLVLAAERAVKRCKLQIIGGLQRRPALFEAARWVTRGVRRLLLQRSAA